MTYYGNALQAFWLDLRTRLEAMSEPKAYERLKKPSMQALKRKIFKRYLVFLTFPQNHLKLFQYFQEVTPTSPDKTLTDSSFTFPGIV